MDDETNITQGGMTLSEGASITIGEGDVVGRDKITTIITDEKTYDVAGLPNPYLGLRSFTYAERGRYAGRKRSVEEAVAKLTTPGEQRVLLFITGVSGSGKSSFAQAGLLPALEAHYDQRSQPVRRAVFRPGAHPIAARDDALKQLRVEGVGGPSQPILALILDQFEELFTQSQPKERDALVRWLTELPPFSTAPQHLIATLRSDYLDELFDMKLLWEVAKQGIELRAMSADELTDAIQRPVQSQYPQGEKRLEPALVDRLAQDAAGEATFLPLLQVTLEELWKKGRLVLSNYGTLTDAIKQRANQVFEFVDYDSASPSQRRSEAEQAATLDLFLGLVNVSPDDDPRRDVRISRVTAAFTPEQRRLTADLSRARLLSVEGDPNGETVNIIHETLIRNWDRLREAVKARRQQLRQRVRFEQQLKLWLENKRSPDYLLLTNVQLAEARELDKAGDIALHDPDAQDLLRRSIEHAEAERQRELEEALKLAESEKHRAEEQARNLTQMRTRNRIITIVGVVALVAAVAAGILGVISNQNVNKAQIANTQAAENLSSARAAQATSEANALEAQHQARLSKAREFAAAAVSNLSIDPERSILLALQAVEVTYAQDGTTLPEALEALHQSLAILRIERVLAGDQYYTSVAFSPVDDKLAAEDASGTVTIWDSASGQTLSTLSAGVPSADGLTRVVFSSDGTKLAATGGDHTARVWEAATGRELLTLSGHKDDVVGLAFSRDGQRIATASWDGTLKVWEAATGRELLTIEHSAALNAVAFSPDDSQLAAGDENGTFIIWNAANGQQIVSGTHIAPPNGRATIVDLAYSPDGTRLATASQDLTAKIWDVASGRELFTLAGHTDWLTNVLFSPDGTHLATASVDGTAIVWDAKTGQAAFTLSGPTDEIIGLSFSQDGQHLATGGYAIRLWTVGTTHELLTLSGQLGQVRRIAFSPDGARLASAGADGMARVWDANTGQVLSTLVGHDGAVLDVAFSPDGKRLFTGGLDGTARMWDLASGQMLFELTGHAGGIRGVAFSPDGTKVVTASSDQTAKVWDAETGREMLTLTGHEFGLNGVAFSPDGSKIATTNDDTTVRVWDAATGKELWTLESPPVEGFNNWTIGVAFLSRDGSKLVATSANKTAIEWDLNNGTPLFKLSGHAAALAGVAVSPDGALIATASRDRTVKVWEASTGRELFTLHGHTDGVRGVAFSLDGTRLASSSDDGTIRIYVLPLEELMSLARSRLTRTWTVDECKKYLQLDVCPPTP